MSTSPSPDTTYPHFVRRCLPCGQEFFDGAGYATHEPCLPAKATHEPQESVDRDTRPAKAPLDRLGEIPRAIRALASQIAYGSSRPGREPGDWRQLKRHELIAKALRHLVDAAAGEVLDAEGRSHLVAAATDCMMAVELEGRE